jgi:hypothetical protein
MSALVDGLIAPGTSGQLLVTKHRGLPSFTGTDVGYAASLPAVNWEENAFHLYATDHSQMHQGEVMLVDANGMNASEGVLQVLTDQGFGSVCNANQAAANVACRNLGYTRGVLTGSSCKDYHGSNVCGALGTPVAMKNLKCKGEEDSFRESTCKWDPPNDVKCLSHEKDVMVTCHNEEVGNPKAGKPKEGTLRLASRADIAAAEYEEDGSGAKGSGDAAAGKKKEQLQNTGHKGRLEVYHNGRWGPICGSIEKGNALMACRSMGFSAVGMKPLGTEKLGVDEGPVNLSSLQCKGSERNINECHFEDGESAQCPDRRVGLLECYGQGDKLGKAPKVEPAPEMIEPASFAPKRALRCEDTLETIGLADAPAGTTLMVHCPGTCPGAKSGMLQGTFIHPPGSSLCAAARLDGVVGSRGGTAVITVGHGQDAYFASKQYGIESADGPGSKRSFLTSIPTPDVLSRIAAKPDHFGRYAGNSVLGDAVRKAVVDFL